MVTFLTSSFVEYQPKEYIPKPLDPSNGFVDNLNRYWMKNAHFLVFASDPADADMADRVTREMYDAFTLAGLPIGAIRCFDDRAIDEFGRSGGYPAGADTDGLAHEALREALLWADVFYLAGGHAPTENAFMKRCGLKELLEDRDIFDGIFIGLSAGTVNAAGDVYLPPELPGEAVDPGFVRFTDGLGLTSINVMPHIEYERTVVLDGMKLVDEILAADSIGRRIYLIPDGAYFIIRNGITEFFGEGETMEDGFVKPLHAGIIHCDNAAIRRAFVGQADYNTRILDAVMSEKFDCVVAVDLENHHAEFYHISSFWLEHGIIPIHIDTFEELNRTIADNLVVPDEREPFVEQSAISVITYEIENKGSYVRTVHLDTGEEIRADNMRAGFFAGDKRRLLVRFTDISLILDHDWMTDEYSRSGFIARAEKLLKEPQYREGYSVVYANVHGFKAVNDMLGIHSGDMVIFMVRDILVDTLKPILTARLESDHFALIAKTSDLAEDKLESMCHQRYIEGTKQLPILIRCGIYHIRGDESSVQRMLDGAKLAEKSLLATHRSCFRIYDNRIRDDYMNKRRLVSELDRGLSKSEFKTYYQPVIDAHTGEILSAEALIRWQHPERGMISPGTFIPVFESEGNITKIDAFMINNVLSFNYERMRKGQKIVPCAVNLSRVDFYDFKLLELLKTMLRHQENVRDMLKLEVTESAYAELESNALSFLAEMKSLGLAIMLDDFGSGMSSLSTLESFDFDVVKLDMGFIAQIGTNSKAEAIIRHTIGLSHDTGSTVVAEGVETKEQLEFLRLAGCDMIQGYYFYKPMPENEFVELLAK